MSRIIDITMELSPDMVIWPGSEPFQVFPICSIEEGAIANSSRFKMGMHTGTHVDAPLHFVADGKCTATVELGKFMGKAKVFPIDTDHNIISADLEKFDICKGDTILLNVAKNNRYLLDQQFHEDYICLDADGADYLVRKQVKAVGINYYSIEAFHYLPDCPVHTSLLKNEIAIFEGLNLNGVAQGEYSYVCLPLKMRGGNGSPVRAVLIEE